MFLMALFLLGCNDWPQRSPDFEIKITDDKTLLFTWIDVPDAKYYEIVDQNNGIATVATVKQGVQSYNYKFKYSLYDFGTSGKFSIRACNESGCKSGYGKYVYDEVFNELVEHLAPDYDLHNSFSYAIDISDDGKVLAVGGTFKTMKAGLSSESETISNAVYIYTATGRRWHQKAIIRRDDTDLSDEFGVSLSLNFDGSILAIGAAGREDSSGAVYIYSGSPEKIIDPLNHISLLVIKEKVIILEEQ